MNEPKNRVSESLLDLSHVEISSNDYHGILEAWLALDDKVNTWHHDLGAIRCFQEDRKLLIKEIDRQGWSLACFEEAVAFEHAHREYMENVASERDNLRRQTIGVHSGMELI